MGGCCCIDRKRPDVETSNPSRRGEGADETSPARGFLPRQFRRAHWLTAKPVPKTLKTASSMFGEIKADEVAAELKKTGIFTGLTLPDAIQKEIARFARETPCFGNFERKLEFVAEEHAEAERRFGRTILSGHHFERVLLCEAAVAVQQDPLLLNVAKHYLGGEAKLITTRTWWSFPTKSASEADLSRASFKFHFDLDDWRMLKFFFCPMSMRMPVRMFTCAAVRIAGA